MCVIDTKTRLQREREAARREAEYQANVATQVEAFVKVVACDCLGLEVAEYQFINSELSRHGTPSLRMTEKEKQEWWRKLAPKLYKILRTGRKRFGWPKIPDHVELRLAYKRQRKSL
jgi:hypothetical protein